MLKGVKLSNFRGFERLELDLKPISVVIGPNSSGKTSVLHAISAAHRAYTLALDAADAHPTVSSKGLTTVCNGSILRDHVKLLPLAVQEEIFRDALASEGATTRIELGFEGSDPIRRLIVQLSYMRNRVLKLTVEVESPSAHNAVRALPLKSKYRPGKLLEALRRDRPVAVVVPAFYGVTLEEGFLAAPSVEEKLQEGQQSAIVRNLVARLSATDLEELNAFLFRTVGARIASRTAAADAERVHPLRVTFSDSNGPLDLSAAGAGVVNLISLFAALKWRQREGKGTTVFLLDEPEAHLHPKLQGQLGDELASLVRGFASAQLIAATHSVEMINRLGAREDTVLLALDRSKSAAVSLDSESGIVDELSTWADLTPFMSLNFLASRRLLFHEGPSDAKVLGRVAEVLLRNRPEALAAFKRWTFVALEGVGNVPGVPALRRVISGSVFPKIKPSSPVRIVLVLDRDRTRKQEFSEDNEGAVRTTRVVWSRHSIESLFLEPGILSQWISASINAGGTDEATIRARAQEAIAHVNASNDLNDAAVRDLAAHLFRTVPKQQNAAFQEALETAQASVRADPASLQKGRDRARLILEHVRDSLPPKERHHVRHSIADLVANATIERLSAPEGAVHEEIRRLVEHMVQAD